VCGWTADAVSGAQLGLGTLTVQAALVLVLVLLRKTPAV
jgi:hypothetical protein